MLPPQAALYGHDRALPVLPPCVHYAGSERYIARALALQGERGPVAALGAAEKHDAPGARFRMKLQHLENHQPAQAVAQQHVRAVAG